MMDDMQPEQTFEQIEKYKEHDSWTINHETGWDKLQVIAWMPLPKPYKEDKS